MSSVFFYELQNETSKTLDFQMQSHNINQLVFCWWNKILKETVSYCMTERLPRTFQRTALHGTGGECSRALEVKSKMEMKVSPYCKKKKKTLDKKF